MTFSLQIGKAKFVKEKCRVAHLKAVLPICGMKPSQILQTLLDKGFEIIVIVLNATIIDKNWLGRKIDKQFI